MVNKKLCYAAGCHKVLPPKARKFCSERCRNRINTQKKRAKKKGIEWTQEEDVLNIPSQKNVQTRRGKVYDDLKESGLGNEILIKKMTLSDVAKVLDVSIASVSMAYNAFLEDLENEKLQESWSPVESEQTIEHFKEFRNRYFQTEQGVPYDTPEFHTRWIESILSSIDNGEQQMILSPPRHGKTDLLIHFVVWLITQNPNVRILWVGGNEDIAKNSVSSVMDQLENNELLIEEICGPGPKFKPQNRSGKAWSSTEFTVGTRTVTGIKSPTMVGIGRGGKILSRDCDIIIADDIEDHSSTMQPASRENTRNWWTTTLSSRKEEHTAMVVIGSRQHYDDLYSHLVDNESWKTIVEEAHDSMCMKPELEEDDHTDCMLWEGKRTFKWLMNRKRDSMTTGGLKNFEMVYLNKAMSEAARLFNPEQIAKCYDINMPLGTIPSGSYLVAGLDPAATGYQAGFLWAVETTSSDIKLTMVDLDNHLGGGLDEAFELIKKWWDMYGCYHWVIEENGFQKAIRQDKTIKQFCNVQGIKLEGHETHKNKWDDRFGVTSLAPMFNDQMITLPYLDAEAQQKTTQYTKQLTYFASKGSGGKGYKSDIVMASWFPMKVVRTLTKLTYADMGIEYTPSFDGYNSVQWNETPWS